MAEKTTEELLELIEKSGKAEKRKAEEGKEGNAEERKAQEGS